MSEKRQQRLHDDSECTLLNDTERISSSENVNAAQEGITIETTSASKTKTKTKKKKSSRQKPPLPSVPPSSGSLNHRPTRASASRLALEDTDDQDVQPVQPPQRKNTKGGGAAADRNAPQSRTISRTLSSSDTSFGSIPMPPTLSYQQTDPISNRTPGVKEKKSYPSPSATLPPAPIQQPFDSFSEDALSSRSNSIRSSCTEGTTNTLDLVLAKRYAAYYGGNPTEAERASEKENLQSERKPPASSTTAKKTMNTKKTPIKRDRSNQILLDEKRRQAGGYIAQDMEQYTFVQQEHAGFEDEHGDDDDESSQEDASLSTAPDPPSLRLREHYLRPGAYRMRQGEEGRHVDNDSLASSSLRTFSTLRTNIAIGVIEASLVEDEETPKRKGKHSEDDGDIKAAASMSTSSHSPICQMKAVDDSDNDFGRNTYADRDCEMPSTPPPSSYAISGGARTFVTTTSCGHVVEAQPCDQSNTIRAFFDRKKIRCMMCILSLIFLVLTIGTIYAVTGFAFDKDGGRRGSDNEIISSNAPSSSPTSDGDLQLRYFAQVAMPSYTKEALEWNNSPQTRALEWLQNNADLAAYPLSRRLQRFALATLYFSTGGERRWGQITGWMSDEDECSWFSTEDEIPRCDDGRLKVLSLQNNGLRGTIPPEISLLSSLEVFSLEENALTGLMPTSFGELSDLRELHLFDNYLSGAIPSELSLLSNMEILDLDLNLLEQLIPPSLSQLPKLRELLLDRNSLIGSIPKEFEALENLQILYLYENGLTGSIHTELGRLSSLVELELDVNGLVGMIPPEIGQWKQLENLNLGNNTLSGPLPTEIGLLTQLIKLDVFTNELSGTLPSDLGKLTLLEEVYLERNLFYGRLSLELGNLKVLKTLWLYSNQLSGVLPPHIGLLEGLVDLDASQNEFAGVLPTELGLLTMMESLNLSSNSFTGRIPSELGLLTSLTTLHLYGNNFTGIMPLRVCNLVSSFNLTREDLIVDCSIVQCSCCSCFSSS